MWNELLKTESSPSREELARWESELSQLMSSERDHLEDLGKNVQQIYETNNFHPSAEELLRYDDEGLPLLDPYVFGMLVFSAFSAAFIRFQRKTTNFSIHPYPQQTY